ncbi:hypothetical protein [Paraburkholderia bannensis]|uniref:hypothetical protein n=1 Tax=Paraburkholderia bannensis TaxID=765414 RepID=UPI002ABE124E|nr:hypothetical protein [Paraburkholderia bannensis]
MRQQSSISSPLSSQQLIPQDLRPLDMNTLVSEADLPDPEDARGIFAFAMTFNGYERYGSLDKSSNLAKQRPRQTLDELRNELFFVARASRHIGNDRYVELYRELLPLFRLFLQH